MRALKELILLHLIFPLADFVMGTCAMKWYRKIKRMNRWTAAEVEAWQLTEFRRFIRHAYDNTAYYRRVFDELRLTPDDIQMPEDLVKLPIVTKDIVREHHEEFIPRNLSRFKYRNGKTGGTTGEPMRYYCDEDVWGYVTANKIVAWQSAGYCYGDRFIGLGASSLFPDSKKSPVHIIYNKLRNGIMLNGVNLTDEICQQYVDILLKKKVRYIYGYSASIYLLTKYVSRHRIDLTQIQAVFTTSEMLTQEYRQLIEETYQCRVMDCYGVRDGGLSAYEIRSKQYHVSYNVIAEVVNPFEENTGTLLTTNFLNYSFPLIRYEFGDEVTLVKAPAQYNGQIITRIFGRTSDVMRLDNGHNLTATGFSIAMREFDVAAFEMRKINGLKMELVIEPIVGKYTKEQETRIMQTFQKYAGEECTVRLTYVDKFEPLKNGKRRYFMV